MDKNCINDVVRILQNDGIVFRHSSKLTSKVLFNGQKSTEVARIAETIIGEKVNCYNNYYKDNGETYACLVCPRILNDVLLSGRIITIDGDLIITQDVLLNTDEDVIQIDLNYISRIKDDLNKRYNY